MDDDPADEEDDFEVDLEAVDVVSCALAVVSLGINALVSEFILVAVAPVMRGRWCPLYFCFFPRSVGAYAVSNVLPLMQQLEQPRHGGNNKKQEERHIILHYLFIRLAVYPLQDCLFIFCGSFHLCWH